MAGVQPGLRVGVMLAPDSILQVPGYPLLPSRMVPAASASGMADACTISSSSGAPWPIKQAVRRWACNITCCPNSK